MASLPLTLVLFFSAPAELPPAADSPQAEAPAPETPLRAEHAEALDDADNGCPLLFGSSEVRQRNRASRERRLEEVERGEQMLDLVHSEPAWREPSARRVPGLEVLSVEASPEGGPVARVQVAESFAAACPAGEYLVSVDDALGAEGQVLALLEEGLLAEHRGELIFLRRSRLADTPRFRMIWRSTFALRLGPGSLMASTGGGKAVTSGRAPPSQARQRRESAKAAAKRKAISTRRPQPRG